MAYFELTSARTRCEELRLRHRIAAARVMVALYRIDALLRKYDPNQPRVPVGSPDGGQWTNSGGGSGGGPRVLSDASPDNLWKPGAQLAQVGGVAGVSPEPFVSEIAHSLQLQGRKQNTQLPI